MMVHFKQDKWKRSFERFTSIGIFQAI